MKKQTRKKRNFIESIATWAADDKKAKANRPFLVERRLKGYTTLSVLFPFVGVIGWGATGSLFGLIFGFIMSAGMIVLGVLQRKRFDAKGYENWRFSVMEHTRMTRLHRSPTGFYADAIDGPYKGNLCHIALAGTSAAPAPGQIIELCVPGGTTATLVRDVYYIPEYYGINFVSEGDE